MDKERKRRRLTIVLRRHVAQNPRPVVRWAVPPGNSGSDRSCEAFDVAHTASKLIQCLRASNGDEETCGLIDELLQISPKWKDAFVDGLLRLGAEETSLNAKSLKCFVMFFDNSALKAYMEQVDNWVPVVNSLRELVKEILPVQNSSPAAKVKLTPDQLSRFFSSWRLSDATRVFLCAANPEFLENITDRLLWPSPPESVQHIAYKAKDGTKLSEFGSRVVLVLAAESGAGKTHTLLTSNPNRLTIVLYPDAEKFTSIDKSP